LVNACLVQWEVFTAHPQVVSIVVGFAVPDKVEQGVLFLFRTAALGEFDVHLGTAP